MESYKNIPFRTFDTDKNGFIDFKEFLLAVDVTSGTSPEKKLSWAFRSVVEAIKTLEHFSKLYFQSNLYWVPCYSVSYIQYVRCGWQWLDWPVRDDQNSQIYLLYDGTAAWISRKKSQRNIPKNGQVSGVPFSQESMFLLTQECGWKSDKRRIHTNMSR